VPGGSVLGAPEFADRDAVLSVIRNHPYYRQNSGKLSMGFVGGSYGAMLGAVTLVDR
jgi:hypothetical protein